MKFKKISAVGFKKGNFETNLTAVTVLRGRNFAGKSSNVEALEFVTTGGLKGLGANGAHSTQGSVLHKMLATGDTMSVCAETDDGKSIFRSLTKDRKDKVSAAARFIGFPNGYAADPVAFSATAFLAMSGPARLKYFFNVLPPPPLDKVGPVAIVSKLKNVTLEPHTEDATEAINKLCGFVESDYQQAFKAEYHDISDWLDYLTAMDSIDKKFRKDNFGDVPTDTKITVQDWLAVLAEQVRIKAAAAASSARQYRATIMGVTQMKAPDAIQLAQAEQAQRQAADALRTAEQALTTAREQYRAKKAELDAAEATAASYTPPETGVKERLEAKVKELTLKVSKPMMVAPMNKERPNIKHLQQARDGAVERNRQLLQEVIEARNEVAQIEKLIAETEAHGTCKTCGQDIKEIQKGIVSGYKKELATVKGGLQKLESRMAGIGAQEAVAVGNLVAGEKECEKFDTELKHHAELVSAAASKNQDEQSLLRLTEKQLQDLKDLASKEEPARLAKERLPKLTQELETLKTQGTQLGEKVTAASTKATEAGTVHKKAVADAASAKTTAEAAKRADKADAEAAVTKELASILSELLKECVKQSIQPLLDTCNSIAANILIGQVAMAEETIGIARDGKFIHWKSLSDGEQLLVMAGLSVALAQGCGFKLVVIPRFESLDFNERTKFIKNMIALVKSKTIDQALIVEVAGEEANPYKFNGADDFSVVNVK